MPCIYAPSKAYRECASRVTSVSSFYAYSFARVQSVCGKRERGVPSWNIQGIRSSRRCGAALPVSLDVDEFAR
ncbi:hypothetical protein ANTPLA_LOCUS8709 [Anthophora plagiata]